MRRLLDGGAYSGINVHSVALIWDLALIKGNTIAV